MTTDLNIDVIDQPHYFKKNDLKHGIYLKLCFDKLIESYVKMKEFIPCFSIIFEKYLTLNLNYIKFNDIDEEIYDDLYVMGNRNIYNYKSKLFELFPDLKTLIKQYNSVYFTSPFIFFEHLARICYEEGEFSIKRIGDNKVYCAKKLDGTPTEVLEFLNSFRNADIVHPFLIKYDKGLINLYFDNYSVPNDFQKSFFKYLDLLNMDNSEDRSEICENNDFRELIKICITKHYFFLITLIYEALISRTETFFEEQDRKFKLMLSDLHVRFIYPIKSFSFHSTSDENITLGNTIGKGYFIKELQSGCEIWKSTEQKFTVNELIALSSFDIRKLLSDFSEMSGIIVKSINFEHIENELTQLCLNSTSKYGRCQDSCIHGDFLSEFPEKFHFGYSVAFRENFSSHRYIMSNPIFLNSAVDYLNSRFLNCIVLRNDNESFIVHRMIPFDLQTYSDLFGDNFDIKMENPTIISLIKSNISSKLLSRIKEIQFCQEPVDSVNSDSILINTEKLTY